MSLTIEAFDAYTGDCLEQAGERSRIRLRGAGHSPGRIRLLHDLRNRPWRSWVPQSRYVSGRERASGEPVSILFRGSLRVVDDVCRFVFGGAEASDGRFSAAPADERAGADLVVDDRPFCLAPRSSRLAMRVPPWVRQELPLAGSWPETLARLPGRQRKELRRLLRRHAFGVSVSVGRDRVLDFRNRVLGPYLQEQYGPAAILPAENAFLDEFGRLIRLDLLCDDRPVATNLVDLRERRLVIAKGAPHAGFPELKGRTDVLDYFTVLLSQLLRCDAVDFGLSRPHLDDGVLRYKAKWGTRLRPCGGLKTPIRIFVHRLGAGSRAFLRHNRFLERDGDGFRLRSWIGGPAAAGCLEELERLRTAHGLRAIELLHDETLSDESIAFARRRGFRLRRLP